MSIHHAEAEVLVNFHPVLGESPVWHPDEGRLYWVDIDRPRIFWFDPATGEADCCYTHPDSRQRLGAMLVQADGSLLVLMKHGAIGVYRDGQMRVLRDHVPGVEDIRFNDAIADPHGRVFSGTHPGRKAGAGVLYRIDPDLTATPLVGGIDASNGLAFTLDGSGLFFVDSYAGRIHLFDYDASDGSLRNQRLFYEQSEQEKARQPGHVDGITVDTRGRLWCAWSRGGRVRCFDPRMPAVPGQASIIGDFEVPAMNSTSLAFGGGDLTDMYITSAVKTVPQGHNGALLRFRPAPMGAQGRPEFRGRVGL